MNNTCDICNILNIFVKRYWTSLVMAYYYYYIINSGVAHRSMNTMYSY